MKLSSRITVLASLPGRTATMRRLRLPGSITSTFYRRPAALHLSGRFYFWPYPENFVPAGQPTSRFHSSARRSERERVISEYALAPLFGARTPCCLLGFPDSPRHVVSVKPALCAALREMLRDTAARGHVELGSVTATTDMMLYRGATALSPRLGDGFGARPDSAQRRLTRYARAPVAARTLVEVFLPALEHSARRDDDEADADDVCKEELSCGASEDVLDSEPMCAYVNEDRVEDVREMGRVIQEAFYACNESSAEEIKEKAAFHRVCAAEMAESAESHVRTSKGTPVGAEETNVRDTHDVVQAQKECAQADCDDAADVQSRLRVCVRRLRDLGVVYCEVPALDEGGFLFDQLHGRDVDASMGSAIVDRWEQRMASSPTKDTAAEATHR